MKRGTIGLAEQRATGQAGKTRHELWAPVVQRAWLNVLKLHGTLSPRGASDAGPPLPGHDCTIERHMVQLELVAISSPAVKMVMGVFGK